MMPRDLARALLILLIVSLSACGLFSRRDIPYRESRNQPPLEVPEDLDRPAVDQALAIPEPASARDVRNPGGSVAQPLPSAGAAATSVAPATTTWDDDALIIADTPDNAWRRIGLALERMGDVDILERDEQAYRYRLEVTTSQRTEGLFRRLFRREKLVRESFDLQLEPAVDGTRIRALGGGDIARTLLKRLQQRLG